MNRGLRRRSLHQKTTLPSGLVNLTRMLNDRPDNLTCILSQNLNLSSRKVNLSVDLPGVEPGRPGLSDRSSKPAKPTPELL